MRLSQEAFRLLYLSETSKGKEQLLEYEDLSLSMESNKDGSLTLYQRLQSHVAFAFGVAASSDVPQVMLQMPNAAAQLVVDSLFRHGILFFFRGIIEDVLLDFFSSKDFFRK
jgi:hypothetical protein